MRPRKDYGQQADDSADNNNDMATQLNNDTALLKAGLQIHSVWPLVSAGPLLAGLKAAELYSAN